ncbi:hypothetical protein [Polycyclovorans algicola]|uniref:hypothetical protein n=1 Tax=Polycyclovorans algicola TaxID=616992 RepID=UPI001267D1C7|nr:hypothetical protein [Polycyclovorans algicola]
MNVFLHIGFAQSSYGPWMQILLKKAVRRGASIGGVFAFRNLVPTAHRGLCRCVVLLLCTLLSACQLFLVGGPCEYGDSQDVPVVVEAIDDRRVTVRVLNHHNSVALEAGELLDLLRPPAAVNVGDHGAVSIRPRLTGSCVPYSISWVQESAHPIHK